MVRRIAHATQPLREWGRLRFEFCGAANPMLPGRARSATGSNVTLKLASAGQNAAKGNVGWKF
jgi:hypothetical protein